MSEKIYLKRKKKIVHKDETFLTHMEEFVAYWRANPHRFITDYLGLTLYDFQKAIIYEMNFFQNFIYFAGRGVAKSTLALYFAVQRAILYPEQIIVIVAPTKPQSARFVKKIKEFQRRSHNLDIEIEKDGIHIGKDESSIAFKNGSVIFTCPYSENALGIRANILIVDEFVRTEKEVINQVFVPFLTNPRKPEYLALPNREKNNLGIEPNRQIYLSSVRGADEWSYESFCQYVDNMTNGDKRYGVASVPYHFGVMNKFITKDFIEQFMNDNKDNLPMVKSELECIPKKTTNNPFYKYNSINKDRRNLRALISMSDYEFITYKNNKNKWEYYQEKLQNEIRIMSIDIALIESPNNDNTAIWIIRMIKDGVGYKKFASYCESIHGLNSIIQTKRIKQLFYEMECDYCVLDVQGSGAGVYDIMTTETFDDDRGITYPAWTVVNQDDFKLAKRTLSKDAVPIIYGVRTPQDLLYKIHVNARNMFDKAEIILLADPDEGVDYYNKFYKYYSISDEDLKARLLSPFIQTTAFVNEIINLKQTVQGGYIKLEERSGKRKDRVMSLIYGMYYVNIIDEMTKQENNYDITDYIVFV